MSKTVYVGKIPYDYTEEQVGEVVRSVGPVSAIRLMFDKDSGKSKGFAFVEYLDAESAASAVRNLNNYQVGNQKLKVDFSDDNGPKGGSNGSGRPREPEGPEDPKQQIANLVSSMSQQDKVGFLADFKVFARLHPHEATKLLEATPQLSYALVQTMIDSGKMTTRTADKLLVEPNEPAPTADRDRTPEPQPKPAQAQPQRRTRAKPAQAQPQEQPAASPSPSPAPVDDNQRQMIMQVMAFSPEQIELLPEGQRHAVLDLRAKVERGEFQL